jgi:hypothetical protein
MKDAALAERREQGQRDEKAGEEVHDPAAG